MVRITLHGTAAGFERLSAMDKEALSKALGVSVHSVNKKERSGGSMIVSVHVYDDGDVELTRHDTKPKFSDDLLFVNDEEALRKELISYGQPEPRIEEALKLLETERCVTV